MPKGDFRFEKALAGKDCAFICEVKKAEPVQGRHRPGTFTISKPSRASYEDAGADCVSCLTEPKWFLGSDDIFRERFAPPSSTSDAAQGLHRQTTTSSISPSLLGADCSAADLRAAGHRRRYAHYHRHLRRTRSISALVETHDAQEMQLRGTRRARGSSASTTATSRTFRSTSATRRSCATWPAGRHGFRGRERRFRAAQDAAALRTNGADAVLDRRVH